MINIICPTTKTSNVKAFHCEYCHILFSADTSEWRMYISDSVQAATCVCPRCRAVCGELDYKTLI